MKFNWKDRYKIKELHRHGEAASVEPKLVEAERRHMQEVLAHLPRKTGGILTSYPFLHLHLQIVGWHLDR
jgi:hypothetical protein